MSERLAPAVDKAKPHNKFPMLRLLTGSILTSAVMACTPGNDQSPTVWNDPSLGEGKPDRGLTSVQMRLDPTYNPAGSSLRMEICFKDKKEKFRIVSEEMSPRPGYLVDRTYPPHEAQCYTKYPVSPIDPGDHEVVNVGLGNTDDELSTNARSYDVIRTGKDTLNIKLLPPKNLGKPGTLKMRDATQ